MKSNIENRLEKLERSVDSSSNKKTRRIDLSDLSIDEIIQLSNMFKRISFEDDKSFDISKLTSDEKVFLTNIHRRYKLV